MPRPFPRNLSTGTQFFIVGCLALSLWLGGLYDFTRDMQKAGPTKESPSADAIVVLTGGSKRLQAGFDLLDKSMGKKLFISGVYRGVEVQELLNLLEKEKPEYEDGTIVLGFEADNTIGNAHETVSWLNEQGYRSFYLVTSNYHLRRALLEFDMTAPHIKAIPYPVTPEGLDMANWWRNKTHRSLIIGEYSKYLFALFRSTISVRP